jgi:ATP-dependent helicase/nuclease subunit B
VPGNTTHHLYDLSALELQLEEGSLALTPNFRLARRIKSEWDARQVEKGLEAWPPAPVQALESWLLQCWQRAADDGLLATRVRIDALQARELWTRVIDKDRRDHSDYSLLQAGSAAEMAQQARDTLLRWRVDVEAADVRSEFALDADCATFSRWLKLFQRELAGRSLATAADCLVDLLGSSFSAGVENIVLVDFDDVQPLHIACLEKLCASVRRMSSATGKSTLAVHSYPDREAELEAVAKWAFERQQSRPGETTGILLTDMNSDRASMEYLLRREFNCLGENYNALPVNFSTGISLDQAPVIRDALRVLATCGDQVSLMDVLGLVSSRFIPRRDSDQQKTVKWLQRLYQDGRQTVSTARLRQRAQTVRTGDDDAGVLLGEVLRQLDGLRLYRQRLLPSDWVEPFCQVLELWQWPGEAPLDSLEYQQVEHWYSGLESFAAMDSVCGKLDLAAALALLRRHCQGQVSQPQTRDSNIQVLGQLEGAGLHFDAIWLCGLQGSRWPAPARPNPFIPMALQRRHQMPHASAEREWLYSESLMRQYRGSCHTMIASYGRQVDGVPELPSPLLVGLEIDHRDSDSGVPRPWSARQQQAMLEIVDDASAPGIAAAELEALGGGSGILQDQASCPFRSFVRNRLSVEPLADYFAGLSAAQRGTLLHNTLFILWGEIVDSVNLQAMTSAAVNSAIEQAVNEAIGELPSALRQLVGMACLELERDRLVMLLGEWIALERDRPKFSVSARERPLELELGGLKLKLRIDRVDTLAGGETLVLDYKSGRSSISDWLGERPSQPQLPLYGIASDVDGVAFAQVKNRDCKLQGLGIMDDVPGVKSDIEKAVRRSSSAGDWGALREEWHNNLERLATEFIAGVAGVDPLPGACNYCGLQSLCRVDIAPQIPPGGAGA